MTETHTMSANLRAFLDMLAWSEGTSRSPYTKYDGYDVVVGGLNSPHTFTDFSKHPDILVKVNAKGLCSTAAGRYQLLYHYWVAYVRLLGKHDFSPTTQDNIAVQQIREKGALPYIEQGDILQAIGRCSGLWASLPYNSYGQHTNDVRTLVDKFILFGGKTHES